MLLAPGVARAAPGWSDPVRVADDGADTGPLLAPLPGGRMLIATAKQAGYSPPAPSQTRLLVEADDGSCRSATADGCSGSVAVSAARARYARSVTVAADRGQWRNLRLPTTARLRRAAKRTRLPVRVAVTSRLAGHESTVTRRKATL